MKRKRILAILLTVLMLLSMIPASAEMSNCTDNGRAHVWGEYIWEDTYPCGGICAIRYCQQCPSRDVLYSEHQWSDWVIVEPGSDCQTWDGIKECRCTICGDIVQDEITGDHIWGRWRTTREATCTEKGRRERACTVCGAAQTDSIDKIAHSWSEWTIIQEAMEGQVGIRERRCTRCGLVQREEYYPDGTIKNGDRGDRVQALQEALNGLGYDSGSPDGIFGNKTEGALKKWQEENGFETDGIGWPSQVDWLIDAATGPNAALFAGINRETMPANGPYFTVGEEVLFVFNALNTGEVTLYNVSLYLEDESGLTHYALSEDLEAEQSFFYSATHIITEEDLQRGYYVCNSFAEGTTEEGWVVSASSRQCYALCSEEGAAASPVEAVIEKYEVSTPANGEYYTAGETIEYMLYFYSFCPHELQNVRITDSLTNGDEPVLVLETLEPMGQASASVFYTVTAGDVLDGYVRNSANAAWQNPETEEVNYAASGIVDSPAGIADPEEDIALIKEIVSQPANGEFYVPGEVITFAVTIVNRSGSTFTDVIVYDPLLDFAELKPYDRIEPGFMDTIEFSYVVTPTDANAGYVENVAFIRRPGGESVLDRIYSNKVTAVCGNFRFAFDGTETTVGGLEVFKYVDNAPANGQYFVPGETIYYMLEVKNTLRHSALHDIELHDALMTEYDGCLTIPSIASGETEQFAYSYVVTAMDVIGGTVDNIVTGGGADDSGVRYMGVSNAVSVPVGEEAPFGVITDMTVVKEEVSAPANGVHYTEGETIRYQIQYINTGEMPLTEVLIFDSLSADGAEIAYAEMFGPGESRVCTFSHTVTAADVEKGYVVNSAMAQYAYSGMYTGVAHSDVVVSDTDGDPNTTYVPGFGVVDWEKVRGTAEPVMETCSVRAVSRDGASVEYEADFCSEHAGTFGSIMTMAAAASDPGRRRMVGEYAFALWQKDVDAMYEEILAGCDDDAMVTVMSERVTYLAMIANTRFALDIMNPDQGAETANAVADLWKNKCIDLCYLMNTAPGARGDSVFAVERAEASAETDGRCGCTVTEAGEGRILFSDGYCPVHGFTYEMMEILLLTSRDEQSWETVRALWDIELESAYNRLYAAAGDESGMACLAEYAAFRSWLTAYENFLMLSYPENPEIVAEVAVNAVMGRVLDVCGRIG